LNRRQSDKDFCLSFGENRSAHLERIEQQGVRIGRIVALDMGDLAATSHEVIRSDALASSCQLYLTHLVYIFHFWHATLNKSVLSLTAKKASLVLLRTHADESAPVYRAFGGDGAAMTVPPSGGGVWRHHRAVQRGGSFIVSWR
jgi:hypothetical protein